MSVFVSIWLFLCRPYLTSLMSWCWCPKGKEGDRRGEEKIKHQFVLVWGGGDVSMGWPCHYMDTGFNMPRNSGEIKHNVVAFLTEWYVVVAFIVLELFRHTISMETINKNLANTKSTQAKTFSWRSLWPLVLSTTTKTKPRHPWWPPTANYV